MTGQKILCQGSVTVGVIDSQSLGRGLFLFPAAIAQKIESLMDQNRPKQGQEIGPLAVRKGMNLFTHGYLAMQLVWIVSLDKDHSELSQDQVLTPSLLRSFYALNNKLLLERGLPVNYEQFPGLKYASMPDLVRKHYFSSGS